MKRLSKTILLSLVALILVSMPVLAAVSYTVIFYTDAEGTASWDVELEHFSDDDTWVNLRGGAGTSAHDPTTGAACQIQADTGANTWTRLNRSGFLFDTSSLPDSVTIISATFYLYGNSKADNALIAPDINVYAFTPTSNATPAPSDFHTSHFGTTSLCDTTITYGNWQVGAYNSFVLNVAGLAEISKTGVTRFGTRNSNYDVLNVEPTWSQVGASWLGTYYAEEAGVDKDPKLVITYVDEQRNTAFRILWNILTTIIACGIFIVCLWASGGNWIAALIMTIIGFIAIVIVNGMLLAVW